MSSYWGFQPGFVLSDRVLRVKQQMEQLQKDKQLLNLHFGILKSEAQTPQRMKQVEQQQAQKQRQYKQKLYELQVQYQRIGQKQANEGLSGYIPKIQWGQPQYQKLRKQLGKKDPKPHMDYKSALQRRTGLPGLGNTVITAGMTPINAITGTVNAVDSVLDKINQGVVKVRQLSQSQFLPGLVATGLLGGAGYLAYKAGKKASQKIPEPVMMVGKAAGNYLVNQYGGNIGRYIRDEYGDKVKDWAKQLAYDNKQGLRQFLKLGDNQQQRQNTENKIKQFKIQSPQGVTVGYDQLKQHLTQPAQRNLKETIIKVMKSQGLNNIHFNQLHQKIKGLYKKQMTNAINQLDKSNQDKYKLKRIVLHS